MEAKHGAPVFRPVEDRPQRLASARKALNEARYQDADELASSILRHDLEDDEAWLIKCKAHQALGNWKRAGTLYRKLASVSKNAEHYEIAARLFRKAGDENNVQFCIREAALLEGLASDES